ncbi:unnamed protein product [Calypogeia fissa]
MAQAILATGSSISSLVKAASAAGAGARTAAGARSSSGSCSRGAEVHEFSGLRRVELGTSSSAGGFAATIQQQLSVANYLGGKSSRGVVTMVGTGKFFVGGNWKANGTKESVSKLVSELNAAKLEDDVDVVVAPPYIYIDSVLSNLTKRIEVAGQNSWIGKGGAFTGEISAEQLKDFGVNWVILGHSERRHILGETDEMIGKKAGYALSKGLKVIACVGELLEEREAGKTNEVVFRQLKAYADAVPSWTDIVIAYEPVWAIGTGKVASPAQAQEVHADIRKWLAEKVSAEVSSSVRIIYGGSVNAANSADLAKKEDIDGFLVGGAALKGPDFATIINSVTSKKVAA